ncbi:MAG: helix-turn-helix domain-containing protein, partial [Pseudomonadota bacterium]
MQNMQISTNDLRGRARSQLVRDTAFELFNLEADLDQADPSDVHADIRVQHSAPVTVVDVRTSWSVVRRTPARASAMSTDHLLLYRIAQGGSWFRNGRGDQFLTRAGSIVLGSQASPYTAVAASGHDWQFRTMRIATEHLPLSGDRIRRGGFQLLPEDAHMTQLVSGYLGSLARRFTALEPAQLRSSLLAADVLLAAALGDRAAVFNDDGAALRAARFASALGHIERSMQNPRLSAEIIARHLGISARQLHRIFEREGRSVSLEIRKARVERAQLLLACEPERAVTDVALACGFDAPAT